MTIQAIKALKTKVQETIERGMWHLITGLLERDRQQGRSAGEGLLERSLSCFSKVGNRGGPGLLLSAAPAILPLAPCSRGASASAAWPRAEAPLDPSPWDPADELRP